MEPKRYGSSLVFSTRVRRSLATQWSVPYLIALKILPEGTPDELGGFETGAPTEKMLTGNDSG